MTAPPTRWWYGSETGHPADGRAAEDAAAEPGRRRAETGPPARDLFRYRRPEGSKIALIVGNERHGLSPALRRGRGPVADGEQVDFAEAVRISPEMSAEAKAGWLASAGEVG